MINGIPRWNNGGHRIPVAVAQGNNKRRLLRASRVGKVAPERNKTEPKYELLGAAEHKQAQSLARVAAPLAWTGSVGKFGVVLPIQATWGKRRNT